MWANGGVGKRGSVAFQVTSFVQMSIRDFDAWQFEKEQANLSAYITPYYRVILYFQNSIDTTKGGGSKNPSINSSAFDEWDNI